MTRTLGAAVLAVALLAGCGSDGDGDGPEPTAASVTLRVEVPDASRTDAVAKVLDGRLRALGAAPASSDTEPGVATFRLPRRLTDDEQSALTATGHLAFRPVITTRPPGAACATPAPKRTDDAKAATGCAYDGTAAYELAPAAPGLRVKTARAQDPAEVQTGVATGEWFVEVELTDAETWRALTEKHAGSQLAIVLDGVVQSAPTVQEAIPNGAAHISGEFSEAEARRIAAVLSGGALPAPVGTVSQTG